MIVEIFAGPGGMSEGVRLAHGGQMPPNEGVESDKDACRTAEAAGHQRLCADVSMLDLRRWAVVTGLLGGPPCQSYSQAGNQKGKLDRPRIERHIARIREAGRWLHYSREGWHDPRSPLVLEALRYALALLPEWIVLEQVPQVLPLWELMADVLRDRGYSVATGVLKAEQYGVPQSRKRAFLAASRLVEARLPAPTHRAYRKGMPQADGDPALLPWVSMADALGLPLDPGVSVVRTSMGTPREGNRNGSHELDPALRPAHVVTGKTGSWRLRSNYGSGGDPAARGERDGDEPAFAVTSKADSNTWLMRSSAMANATVRSVDEPAPTITAGHDRSERVWGQARNSGPAAAREPRSLEQPSYTIRANGSGSHPSGVEWVPLRRVSVEEAAVLQSFRPDYPWQGSPSVQYRQVGDAAPPVLVAAVIRELIRA